MGTLHAPLAHRWKDVPPMQFQAPSFVQAPERVVPEPPPVELEPEPDPPAEEPVPEPVPVPAGEAADVVADPLPLPESGDADAGIVDVASVVGADTEAVSDATAEAEAGAPPEPAPGTVTKTPPGTEAEEEALEREDCELETEPRGVKDAPPPVKVLVTKVLEEDVLSVGYGGYVYDEDGEGDS
jgi:hypothetical protein